jgi:type I restriction enzyme S subunit
MSKVKIIPELRFKEFEKDGEWVDKKLGDLGEFLGGGTPSRTKNEYWIGNIPWISSSDINEEDIHNISISQYINEIAIAESATKIIQKGSVLFVSRVGVGKLAINKEELCTSQDFTSFIPKEVVNLFVAYSYLTNKKALQSLSQGTSIKGFSISDLKDSKIIFPKNNKEQQKIASCLSSLDEIIATHRQKLNLLKDHKKGMMQNLFPQEGEKVPKYRFKEFEKKWEKVKLKDVSTYFNGGSYENDVKEDGKYELITLKSINKYGQLVNSKRYIDIEVATLSIGTLVMILSEQAPGLLGMTAIIPENNKYVLNQRVAEIRPNQKVISFFLSMAINRNQVYFSKQGAGMKVQNITKPNVENYEFLVPEINEQQKIASCLSSLDALITAQAEKIAQLKLHKKGLMQGLFPKIEI